MSSLFPILVRDIVGDGFEIPEKIRGKIGEISNFTKKWIEENVK